MITSLCLDRDYALNIQRIIGHRACSLWVEDRSTGMVQIRFESKEALREFATTILRLAEENADERRTA